MAGYKIVEEVKKRKGIKSDNGIAKAIARSRSRVSMWKTTDQTPSADALLDLMILGDLSAQETKKLLQEEKQGGYVELSLVCALAGMLALTFVLTSIVNNPLLISELSNVFASKFVYYVK